MHEVSQDSDSVGMGKALREIRPFLIARDNVMLAEPSLRAFLRIIPPRDYLTLVVPFMGKDSHFDRIVRSEAWGRGICSHCWKGEVVVLNESNMKCNNCHKPD